VIYTAMSIKVS